MIYSLNIVTPKNTSQTAPKKTILKVTKGLVYKVDIDFPPGSAGLMGVSIFDGSYQIWPSTLNQWFTGDNTQMSFDDIYLKEAAPYIFNMFTYNEDDTYSHLVIVRIGLVSKKTYMARFLPHLSYEYFTDMLRELGIKKVEQLEQQKQDILENPLPWLADIVKA